MRGDGVGVQMDLVMELTTLATYNKSKIKMETMAHGFGGKSVHSLAGFLDYIKNQGKTMDKEGGEGRGS